MKQSKDLERLLKSLDGQKYGAYKRMKGIYQFDQFRLAIDRQVRYRGNHRLKRQNARV